MPLSASFTGPGNSDPVAHFLKIRNAANVTIGDCLWAGQFLRTRIRQRTASGIDVNEVAFAPYSKGYAARKVKELGHADVDLFGFARGVHMLNAMLVKAGGQELSDYSGSATTDTQSSDLFTLGIYDEELATRARVHNEGGQSRSGLGLGTTSISGTHSLFGRSVKAAASGSSGMPKREFFAANNGDIAAMENGIGARQVTRLEALAG
jgi:hypothetical protein